MVKDIIELWPIKVISKVNSVRIRRALNYLGRRYIGIVEYISLKGIKDNEKILVYDSYTASNRYGDFIYFCMLAKVIIFRSQSVKIIFLSSGVTNENDVAEDDLINVLNTLLRNYSFKFEKLNFNEFIAQYKSSKNILFKSFIVNKVPSYLYYYELIVRFNKEKPLSSDNNFYINNKSLGDLTHSTNPLYGKKYITWVCRYTGGEESERDTSKNEFISIRDYLFNNFKDVPILLVSDILGCNYFKSIEPEDNYRLMYSKDISKEDDFLFDAGLLVSSSLIIQLRGGGIILPALFSATPYILIAKALGVERRYSKNKLTPWSCNIENQHFYLLDYWDERLINDHKYKLKSIFDSTN